MVDHGFPRATSMPLAAHVPSSSSLVIVRRGVVVGLVGGGLREHVALGLGEGLWVLGVEVGAGGGLVVGAGRTAPCLSMTVCSRFQPACGWAVHRAVCCRP